MQYSQNELLLFYFFIVICVVASFIAIRRKPRDPVKLRLESKNKKPVSRNQSAQAAAQAPQAKQNTRANTQTSFNNSRKEKTLNAFFNFDGKQYDAYEVLGLPAGASIKAAQSAFNAHFVSAQGGQRALLKAALEAIRRR